MDNRVDEPTLAEQITSLRAMIKATPRGVKGLGQRLAALNTAISLIEKLIAAQENISDRYQ